MGSIPSPRVCRAQWADSPFRQAALYRDRWSRQKARQVPDHSRAAVCTVDLSSDSGPHSPFGWPSH